MASVKKSDSQKSQPPSRVRKYDSEYDTSEPEIKPVGKAQAAGPKKSDLKIRLITSAIMIFGFLFILYCGHFYTAVLVFVLNSLIFSELLLLKRNREREQKIPLFYLTNWYFFFITEFMMIIRVL